MDMVSNGVLFSCILLFLQSTTDGAQFCYSGIDVNSLNALKNETCLTKELHLPKSLMSDNQQTSPAPEESKDGEENLDIFHTKNKSQINPIFFCFTHRFITTKIYPSGVLQQSVHVAFGCDSGHVCSNKELNKILHNVTGDNSELYCCHDNNCNNVDHLLRPGSENRFCYHGSNNVSYSPRAKVLACTQPDVSCARKTIFHPQRKIREYFCDNGKSCSQQMSSGAFRSCANTTSGNLTQELCCCNTNNCFVPSWPAAPRDSESKMGCSFEPIGDTINKPRKKKTSTALITGLASAIAVAGFAAGIIFLVAYKKRKRHKRRDPNVIMQYERLSVSDAEIADAVVLSSRRAPALTYTFCQFPCISPQGDNLSRATWAAYLPNAKGVIFLDILPQGQCINAARYCSTLDRLKEAIRRKRPGLLRRSVVLQHDNATPHSANLKLQWLQRHGWEILPHPAHSLDLAPSDFHLFGPLKRHLGGMAFETEDDLISKLRNWFDNLDVDFFRAFQRGIRMQTPMAGRPRPVTATVTKPRWMTIPSPDAIRKIRKKSLESNGSTESLTSLLDHDSYNSTPEVPDDALFDETQNKKSDQEENLKQPDLNDKRCSRRTKTKSDSNLSAWERWVIQKAKDERQKKLTEKQRKKEEKMKKEKEEEEKREKLLKAEVMMQVWLEKKKQSMTQQKKAEKARELEEERKKEEINRQIQQKASEKFSQWEEMKRKEAKERKQKIKMDNKRIQEFEKRKKEIAEQKYQEWLQMAKNRPKSAPNSFGYLSGKMTGECFCVIFTHGYLIICK
ncbi:histone-lysine N-methyltransferase SETMAR [Plakobranchus ocellatus]|uniref:Histone-lysine N-methyltransferase SETMAR n=1 Tax=Plakobranchus ocellatus TaxID=259542 RepID=A0AAV4DW88_9GAST|nr:histone-lysine N-methyltransferase SETMAR [Plakobranchus ocellatus]